MFDNTIVTCRSACIDSQCAFNCAPGCRLDFRSSLLSTGWADVGAKERRRLLPLARGVRIDAEIDDETEA